MIYLVAEVNKVNEFHGLSFRNLLNVIFEKKKKATLLQCYFKTKYSRKLLKCVDLEPFVS